MHAIAPDRHRQYRDQALAVWPGDPPGGGDGAEFWKADATAARYHGIQRPTLTWFVAPQSSCDAAVLICPGGGFRQVSVDHEGWAIAESLNLAGIHAAVLTYRHAGASADEPYTPRLERAVADVRRGLRVMRMEGERHAIEPDRIGVLGFSSGALLARLVASGWGFQEDPSADEVAEQPAQPAHIGMIHPVHSDSVGLQIPDLSAEFPPTFMVGARHDDHRLAVRELTSQLLAHDAPHELHVYADDERGDGAHATSGSATLWLDAYVSWLQDRSRTK